ncbi:MAG: hypothetical protein K2W95_26940 [Candidatus Obscuribacterales bacterium]|nr:hypothetical protein [Candidatus Obscuribacterales bacterium]
MNAVQKRSWCRFLGRFVAAGVACLSLSLIAMPMVGAAETVAVKFTAADLATANGSARIGTQSGILCCVLTSTEFRVQLDPDRWDSDAENTNWTTWLTAFDDNLYANWIKNAPLNAQETVGIRINPDSSVSITNNTFLPGSDVSDPTAQGTFEAAISASLNEALKVAKPMPVTKNKLKEVHMSLTFMREPRALPRYGKNDYGFVAVLGDKGAVTVYERTSSDGRFPGIQIRSNNDDDKVVPLEQAQFNQKAAEAEQPAPPATAPVTSAPNSPTPPVAPEVND